MLFNSISFLIFFPLVFFLYFSLPGRLRPWLRVPVAAALVALLGLLAYQNLDDYFGKLPGSEAERFYFTRPMTDASFYMKRLPADRHVYFYSVAASFRLIDSKAKKVVFQGTSHARAPFERFESIYSNVRAREDAENRAARTIADDLKSRLAAYLSRPA